jgi:hypothetical protein
MAGLWDALKQYIGDALPGGALSPETQPVATQANYLSGILDPASQVSQDAQAWHKRTQNGLMDQLAGRDTPEAEQAYQTMMQAAGVAPVGMTKYGRRSQSTDSPFNDVDYAIFAEAKNGLRSLLDELKTYGPGKWAATDASATPINEIQKDIVREIRRSGIHTDYQTTAANLAREADPKSIVNSAGVWDSPDLASLIYEKVLAPQGIRSVKTSDGLIVFDKGIPKKVGR